MSTTEDKVSTFRFLCPHDWLAAKERRGWQSRTKSRLSQDQDKTKEAEKKTNEAKKKTKEAEKRLKRPPLKVIHPLPTPSIRIALQMQHIEIHTFSEAFEDYLPTVNEYYIKQGNSTKRT